MADASAPLPPKTKTAAVERYLYVNESKLKSRLGTGPSSNMVNADAMVGQALIARIYHHYDLPGLVDLTRATVHPESGFPAPGAALPSIPENLRAIIERFTKDLQPKVPPKDKPTRRRFHNIAMGAVAGAITGGSCRAVRSTAGGSERHTEIAVSTAIGGIGGGAFGGVIGHMIPSPPVSYDEAGALRDFLGGRKSYDADAVTRAGCDWLAEFCAPVLRGRQAGR